MYSNGRNGQYSKQQQKQTTKEKREDYKYLIVKNLNKQTIAETLYDYFQQFANIEDVTINVDENTNMLDGTALITFRTVPKGRSRERLSGRHTIDGRVVQTEFAKEKDGSHHAQWNAETTSSLSGQKLSLGNFLSAKHFVEQWSTTTHVRYRVQYTRRLVDVFFTHLNVDYKLSYNFKEMMGNMTVERENDLTTFTISLRYPPRYWRRNTQIVYTSKLKKTAGGWERITMIPLTEEDAVKPKLKEPILPMARPDSVKIGVWTTLRISFASQPRQMTLFDKEMQKAAEYNLVPRDPSKMKPTIKVTLASDLPRPLDHLNRLEYNFDFSVLYLLESVISYNLIDEHNLDQEFYSTIQALDASVVCGILDLIAVNKKRVWEPLRAFRNIWDKMELKVCQPRKIPNHCAMLRKVIVTPSTLFIEPPNLETTNRVVRHYQDHADRFIRVQFMDEGFNRVGAARSKKTNEPIYDRIYDVLKRGIQIGDRKYEFLAFSSSQLREHGCWFFASTPQLTPDMIRRWMGVFSHEKVVAKHAVRMGQCFSSTRPICHLEKRQVKFIPDVVHNTFTFSDGVGRIAPSLAEEVAHQMDLKSVPSAFQFRLGGAKGVLTVDRALSNGNVQVELRPSQIKFESEHLMLEVIRTSAYIHGYLNRQAITLLSALGVKDEVFLELMGNMLRDIDKILARPEEAIRVLLNNADEAGTAHMMASIIQAGFLERGDPYIKNLLNLFRVNVLKELKKKAKILVPQGAFLLGVMDETNTLDEGEVYIQVWDNSNSGTMKQVITGECAVFRNPCFHPGDIRVVTAVDKPNLSHLVNVIVFPAKGYRDIPSMCSGGDLDGDDYTIFWDPKLIPVRKDFAPMDYTASDPRKVEDVKIRDIQRFFVNYINNDNLGQIANAHLATADFSDKGAMDGRCILLAQLHSEAVDFPKSGKPATLSEDLIVRTFPDFMQKKDKESYPSKKVLGHIFRSIDKSDYKDYMSKLTEEAVYDARMHLSGMEYYIGEARALRRDYNRDLLALMNQNGVQTEAEIVSGYIIKWLKKGKSKTRYEQHNSTMKAIKSFKDLWRKEFEKEFMDDTKKAVDPAHRASMDAKAAAWYYVTYHPEERQRDFSEQGGFLSFPWVIHDYVCEIAKRNKHRELDASHSLPVPESVIDEQHAMHMHSKRLARKENGEAEEDKEAEVKVIEEEESEFESDYSEDETAIYGANTALFTFNNTELQRAVQELNLNSEARNNWSDGHGYHRPAGNNPPILRADATEDDLMKAFLG
ncbi:hypothetical protein G6F37_004946 [Rhizopus arrhizus]|nr:hypothetical protein G6F38_001572 [Rhizopus arrhizus]KAG1159390.1 hypothetical protein G6F37_004946 [Rhizopus arrhizus]